MAKQVELEQALFDIEQARGLLQTVKKTVLEGKLQVFEKTHADAKGALESKHAAACAACLSHIDLQHMSKMHQAELGQLELQHEQRAELLRVEWVLELKAWSDSVAMLCDRMRQKVPDAGWLSDLLRKANRAQRCSETALEMESFLTNYCANPDQTLSPDMWSQPSRYTSMAAPSSLISPGSNGVNSNGVDAQDVSVDMDVDMEVSDGEGCSGGAMCKVSSEDADHDAKRKPRNKKKSKIKESAAKREKDQKDEVVDESCPLYRCQGCDKVFVVAGVLSVADLKGLNAGTKRYIDSKTARAARDTHRRNQHPNLVLQLDSEPAPRSRAHEIIDTPASSASRTASLSSLRSSLQCETSDSVERERVGDGTNAQVAEVVSNGPDLGIRRHGCAALPRDPRLSRGNHGPGFASARAQCAMPKEDFIPAAASSSRDGMEGYVYKYGSSGPGYYRIVAPVQPPRDGPVFGQHAASEESSRDSRFSMEGAAGGGPVAGGKKSLATVIQERIRKEEEAEKARLRKDLEEKVRLETEAKVREEYRQVTERLEHDRLQQQREREAEERERARKQEEERKRVDAELLAMKEQLNRQERERQRQRDWEQRRHNDFASRPRISTSPPRPERARGSSAAQQGRITMEDRMSARIPSPPSPLRGRLHRCRDDSDVEEGEVREDESPPRLEDFDAKRDRERRIGHQVSSDSEEGELREATPPLIKPLLRPHSATTRADGADADAAGTQPATCDGPLELDAAKANGTKKPAKRKGGGGAVKCGKKHRNGAQNVDDSGGHGRIAGNDEEAGDVGDDVPCEGGEGSDSGPGLKGWTMNCTISVKIIFRVIVKYIKRIVIP